MDEWAGGWMDGGRTDVRVDAVREISQATHSLL